MAFEKPAVVIDNGSHTVKAGFACDNHPISMFRNVIGRPNYLKGSYGRGHYDVYIGDSALEGEGELELSHPITNGTIVHWDNIERIWHNIFYKELKVAPEDRAVMLAASNNSSLKEKIECCEIFFETLNSPAICIQSQSALCMYGSGSTTGICVDMGHDSTDITPVYEGGPISYANICTGLAGSQISEYLKRCLQECNTIDIKSPNHIECIKRQCYVTSNCAMSTNDCIRKYTLPSGEVLDITNEVFMSAEMIFQPELVLGERTNYVPLHEATITAALKCDADLQPEFYNSIALCGGVSMIPGLSSRLAFEIEKIVDKPFQILSSPEGYAVVWLGGAVFAGMPDGAKMWVNKQQFDEYGGKIVKNKFSN